MNVDFSGDSDCLCSVIAVAVIGSVISYAVQTKHLKAVCAVLSRLGSHLSARKDALLQCTRCQGVSSPAMISEY